VEGSKVQSKCRANWFSSCTRISSYYLYMNNLIQKEASMRIAVGPVLMVLGSSTWRSGISGWMVYLRRKLKIKKTIS
jgi:hypothetical protein